MGGGAIVVICARTISATHHLVFGRWPSTRLRSKVSTCRDWLPSASSLLWSTSKHQAFRQTSLASLPISTPRTLGACATNKWRRWQTQKTVLTPLHHQHFLCEPLLSGSRCSC